MSSVFYRSRLAEQLLQRGKYGLHSAQSLWTGYLGVRGDEE